MSKKCAVLVSGGVDSSVALRLLQEQGYELTAFYLKIWLEDELTYLGNCPWEEDLAYVQAVCEQAQVPLEVVSFQRDYWNNVIAHTIAEIRAGRTPNPDILCNQRVKFGAFASYVSNDFEFIASGHYARLDRGNDQVELHVTEDSIKDQTYFLSHVSQQQLQRLLFPLGHLKKEAVRSLATHYNLPNKDRKDSQGICFLGKLKFSDFVKHHMGEQQGPLIEHETGLTVGTHNGFWFYTIGQRQGLGLSGGPWYVVAKDPHTNSVMISKNYYADDMMRDSFIVENCNWINSAPHDGAVRVKLRHGPAFNDARLEKIDQHSYRVTLVHRDQGLAEGQYAVFYDGTRCLGGGVITHGA